MVFNTKRPIAQLYNDSFLLFINDACLGEHFDFFVEHYMTFNPKLISCVLVSYFYLIMSKLFSCHLRVFVSVT